ncbi:MAG: OmpA family protein [Proteobacteria bacterium]|nr:OmpA family protein [Pseudomonadota bacterium]
MSRLLLTAAVLAILVYAMVLGVRWLTPRIEQDIADRVTTSLAEQGLLWADVAVQGREVTLSGTAPNEAGKERALAVASKVFGVAKVDDKLEVADAKALAGKGAASYGLTITKDGDKVSVVGAVPTQADKDVLVRLANRHYGEENVDASKLEVAEGAPAGWRTAAGTVLYNIFNMENATVTFSGTEVMISGTVVDQQFSDQVENAVTATLPQSYKVAYAVDVVTPTTVSSEATVEPAAGPEGCAMDEVKGEKVYFGFDEAKLTAEDKPVLDKVAAKMDACADSKMVLAGFTDKTGSALYNKWLSQQRAEAAMRGLMRHGVAKERLKPVGYGEAHPLASNATRDGRAKNRRVEFYPGEALPYEVTSPTEVSVKKVVAPVQTAAAAAPAKPEIAKPWWAKPKAQGAGKDSWLGDSN